MSIWSDTAVQELQEKVTQLEKDVAYLQQKNLELLAMVLKPDKSAEQAVNGTLHVKRKI